MSEMTREEAINELTEALMEINPNDLGREEILRWAVALEMAIEALKEQRPRGEWIETSNIWETEDLSGWGYYKECSCCHDQVRCRTPFCSTCGADMRKKGGKV